MNNRPNFYLQFVSPDHPVELIPTDHDLIPAFKEFPDILMERYAAFALQALISKLHAHGKIVPVSGFRTQQEQQKICLLYTSIFFYYLSPENTTHNCTTQFNIT